MNAHTDSLVTVALPITATDRCKAAEFAGQQPTPQKANQVYRNTLAVIVTRRYLQMLTIRSELLEYRWDRLERWLKKVADLYIPEVKGYLECRAIARGEERCFVPEKVQHDSESKRCNRIGYIVVQLDEPYREGVILGFVPQGAVTEIPLNYLQPLDALIDRLTLPQPVPAETNLSDWLRGIFEFDWQPRRGILKPPKRPILLMCNVSLTSNPTNLTEAISNSVAQLYQQANLDSQHATLPANLEPSTALVHLIQTTQNDEIRWQAAELLWDIDPEHPASPIVSARDLGMYLGGHAVALMVGVLPKLDGRQLILLRVYPIQNEPYLPAGLKLAGFDEANNALFELESRHHDNYIQFKLIADPGDRFGVKVSFNDASVSENFCV